MKTPESAHDTKPVIGRRVGGCLVGFLLFTLVFTLGEAVGRALPTLLLQVMALLSGLLLIQLFRSVARARWRLSSPDVVQVLALDLTAFRRWQATDVRVRFPRGTPFKEHAIHELLYALKWCGHLLVVTGLGSLLYAGMQRLGIAS